MHIERALRATQRRTLMIARLALLLLFPILHGCAEATPEDLELEEHIDHDELDQPEPQIESVFEQATAAIKWTHCAHAYAGCRFSGLRDVRMVLVDGRTITREFYQDARCGPGDGGFEDVKITAAIRVCQYGPMKFASIARPDRAMGPRIDLKRIPRGSSGYRSLRVHNNGQHPGWDVVGAFRTVCPLSHMSFDDPLVFPGNPGAAHLHAFFGNTATHAGSNARSIANSGNSTCRGGIANRSAYWVPALIDTKDGRPVIPDDAQFYYKTGYHGIAPASVQAMPRGLRMIAGDVRSKGPQPYVDWTCLGDGRTGPSVQNCGVGQHLQLSIVFPQCWNGKDLDSSDHKRHMAYPTNGRCPPSHPRAIPEISFKIRYLVTEANAPRRWRLSSDTYDAKLPAGYSAHGDWWDGWNEDVKGSFVRNCLNRARDCHSNLLGDGRAIY